MKAITVVSTTSQAGKSVLTTAICRILARRGIRVAPFKGVTLSSQSYLTEIGGEMGYAQALQAWAAGISPAVEMNPILLKPKGDNSFKPFVKGKGGGTISVTDFCSWAENDGWTVVRDCLDQLTAEFDALVCEGAGSVADLHLKRFDLSNMRVARHLNSPTLLAVDIERGGALAQVLGTLELLDSFERALVRGIVINKWQGSRTLLQPGLDWLEERTGLPVLGVIPWNEVARSNRETLNPLERHSRRGHNDVTLKVVRLPRMTNFSDFDPLEAEPSVQVKYVSPKQSIGYPDAVILPGTRSTIADLLVLQETGMAEELKDYVSAGGTILGMAGGFQMLGQTIADPEGIEGVEGRYKGLGLVPMKTVITTNKIARQRSVTSAYPQRGLHVVGYEIHRGRTQMSDGEEFQPLFDDESLGVVDKYQSIWGTYLHGLFDSGPWRRAWLNRLRQQRGLKALPTGIPNYREQRETLLEDLAELVQENLDLTQILQ